MNQSILRFFIWILFFSFLISACQPGIPPASTPCPAGGCIAVSPSPISEPTATPAPTRQFASQQDRLKGVTITLWNGFTGEPASALKELIRQFNLSNRWGIDVQLHSTGDQGNLVDDIQSANENDRPDLALLYPEQAFAVDAKGFPLTNLDPFIDDPDVGLTTADRKNISAQTWSQDIRNGTTYGLPALRDLTLLFYNQTWAQELGFTSPPKNYADFKEQACKAAQTNLDSADKTKPGTGGWLVSYSPLTAAAWLRAFGATEAFTTDEVSKLDSPQSEKAFTALQQLETDGCAWLGRIPEPYDYFANRQALFYSGSTLDLDLQTKAFAKSGLKDQWTVIPYPGTDGSLVTLESGLSYYILSGESNKQLAAWLLIRWLSQPEKQSALITAAKSIPVYQNYREQPSQLGISIPQWISAVEISTTAMVSPHNGAWYAAQNILSDAFWQVFQPETKAEQIPVILQQLDSTIKEVTTQKP